MRQLDKKIKIMLLTMALCFQSCFDTNDVCSVLKLADLIIPSVVQHIDNQGRPLFEASNELYYNERTGEYFNRDNPPRLGIVVGDYIQMATQIFNTTTGSNCELGKAAPTSTTAPKLTITSPSFTGVFPTPAMITPPIPVNDKVLTATRFQLITPGNYKVNFNANAPRNIQEHRYENNFYYGQDGNYRSETITFNVTGDPVKYYQENQELLYEKIIKDSPNTIEEMKDLEIYKFMKSQRFVDWHLKK